MSVGLLVDKTMIDNSTSENINSGSLMNNENQQESNIVDIGNEVAAPPQPFIPEPEAPIDPTECQIRLLEHIEHFQYHIDSRLTSIETQICGIKKKRYILKIRLLQKFEI